MIKKLAWFSGRVSPSRVFACGSALGLVLTAATPAAAVPMVIDITGTMLNGFDGSGLFGPERASLGGLSYSVRYLMDPERGFRTTGEYWEHVSGGSMAWSPNWDTKMLSPSLGASLTINGHTVTITGDESGDFYSDLGVYWAMAQGGYKGFTGEVINHELYATFPTRLDTPFSAINEGINGSGNFSIMGSRGDFQAEKITVSHAGAITAVPEPATWAMMLIGVGAVGATVRRRKVKTTVAYA